MCRNIRTLYNFEPPATQDEIQAAAKFLLTRMKILVEPSGAVSAAAVLFHKLPAGINRIGVVLSGGNVDL